MLDRQHSDYTNGMIQGSPPLMCTQNFNGITLTSKLAATPMKSWIGADSFKWDGEYINWQTLINKKVNINDSLIASWRNITTEMDFITETHEIIESDVVIIWDGIPSSITKYLTTKIKGLRSEVLSIQVLTNTAAFNLILRGCLAYYQANTLSSQFLPALLNVLGITTSGVILKCFHQHLGLPSLVMCPYVDIIHYIGQRNREAVVSEYCDIAATSMMIDREFIWAYEQNKGTMTAIFKQWGYSISVKTLNIFNGKVLSEYFKTVHWYPYSTWLYYPRYSDTWLSKWLKWKWFNEDWVDICH